MTVTFLTYSVATTDACAESIIFLSLLLIKAMFRIAGLGDADTCRK